MNQFVYEDELVEEFATESTDFMPTKYETNPMGDIKFMTAKDFIDQQNKFTQQQWDRTVGYGKVPEEYAKKEYVSRGVIHENET